MSVHPWAGLSNEGSLQAPRLSAPRARDLIAQGLAGSTGSGAFYVCGVCASTMDQLAELAGAWAARCSWPAPTLVARRAAKELELSAVRFDEPKPSAGGMVPRGKAAGGASAAAAPSVPVVRGHSARAPALWQWQGTDVADLRTAGPGPEAVLTVLVGIQAPLDEIERIKAWWT